MSAPVPFDEAAEASVLGAMLLSRDAIFEVLKMGLQVSDFHTPIHQVIVEAIYALHAEPGAEIDPVTVGHKIGQRLTDVGGMPYLNGLIGATPAVSGAAHYAQIVEDSAILRDMIHAAAAINELAYNTVDVSRALAEAYAIVRQLVTAADRQLLRGYYDDSGLLNTEGDRNDAQPWIARGVLRRNQRQLIVARAGIGKSVLLRQLAVCCVNGVHPYTGQRTEVPREALIVELEAGEWDISSSLTQIGFGLQRVLDTASVWDLNRPALLHRPGGLDLRSSEGFATLEAAIRRAEPDLVVMGPLKYLSIAKPGENYEIAALNLMAVLNDLMERYRFGLVMEAHFSRGDRGAPGGSERWVDWPDVGFGIHPPSDDLTQRLPDGASLDVKQFRIPRDSDIWVPNALIRGGAKLLPWSVKDYGDPYRISTTIFTSRYGGMPASAVNAQGDLGDF